MPGNAMAARFFSSPIRLAKHATPSKVPTYRANPMPWIVLRNNVLMVELETDSLPEAFNGLMLRNFKPLTSLLCLQNADILNGFPNLIQPLLFRIVYKIPNLPGAISNSFQ